MGGEGKIGHAAGLSNGIRVRKVRVHGGKGKGFLCKKKRGPTASVKDKRPASLAAGPDTGRLPGGS